MTVVSAVLFDLGNTLAAYYRPEEFRPILELAIDEVLDELRSRRIATVAREAALEAALAANREADDFGVVPIGARLDRIFELEPARSAALADALCERFMAPIFAMGRVYEDTLPALRALREAGLRTAIVSNAPWGSPTRLWRRELERLGLLSLIDSAVFCGDVGWRKPARQIFEHAAARLGVECRQCVFVGDDLRWDIDGAAAAGMQPILIDRGGRHPRHRGARVTDLNGVVSLCAMPRATV